MTDWKCICESAGTCPVLKRNMSPMQHAVCRGERLTPAKRAGLLRIWSGVGSTEWGMGAALLEVARELGVGGLDCGCTRLAANMNAWGLEGCERNRAAINPTLWEIGARATQLPKLPDWFDPADATDSLFYRTAWVAENHVLLARRPEFVTTEQLVADVYRLAAKLPRDLAGIVGIARSGILPANLLCQHLHLPMWILRQDDNAAQPSAWGSGDVTPTGNGWRLHDRPVSRDKRPTMLVVDDTQMTGRSLRRGRPIAEAWARQHGYNLLWAVIYQNPLVKPRDRAPLFVRSLPRPHFLEWNFFNSHLLRSAAFDLDGVLCDERQHRDLQHGPPPLYPARKEALKLIVTGRHERHRAGTLAWLAHWGIRCQRIEMLPNNRNNRDPLVCAAHKARHFAASGLSWFVESCPVQAAEIARLTGKPVICPAAAKVY